jgi:cephalosporin hydroxylase
MFPLWEAAIAPVLAAARPRRVVEIGAFRGETTELMLDLLGPEAELHVIDPSPTFDVAAQEESFTGAYHFHADVSHNVLPRLGPMDAALIDGDHNWYTVFHELRMLADAASGAGELLPLLILHDVGWPYGRRDLYYAPERIPEEFRQPWRRAGMRLGQPELFDTGGANPTMCNAEVEGGPRNGVMTALEDFLAQHPEPARTVVLPVYFGLAIVAEERRLARQPELVAALDRLEAADGQRELLTVAETTRLRAMTRAHMTMDRSQRRLARAATRYLELLKGALLNEHYLENEIRLKYLARCLREGEVPEPDRVRDPIRAQPGVYSQLLRKRKAGVSIAADRENGFLPYATLGRTRLDHLERCLDEVRMSAVPGDLVECATGRGGAGIFLRGYLAAHELPDRKVWVADEFRATPPPNRVATVIDESMSELQADLNLVRDAFERFDLLDGRVRFLQGAIDASLPTADIERVALLRLGAGIGDAALGALEALYPKLAIGGFVVVDDHRDAACERAVTTFRERHAIAAPVEAVDASAITWRKTEELEVAARAWQPVETGSFGLPLAPPAPTDAIDLTVVVVFYNMRREAARTLRSLSRTYQLDLDDVSYEVIAIENGSAPEQKLGAELVESFGPEFRYIDLGDEAHPSPVHALNRGIKEGRGNCFTLMIDGAHVLTPSVLRFGLTGLRTYHPAIVATQPWYVGPGQQGEAMSDGYDQAYEDRLFRRIGWPDQGYRLFEIGHFVGGRDWLDGMWESNCLFVRREQLEQVGGFDESYDMAGGGFANLDIYERLGSSPDVTVVSIIGEGSFHQLHGGVTTNQTEADRRHSRIHGYREHFAELRGRTFRGHGKPIHYVGRFRSPEARRTRARRLTVDIFSKEGPKPAPDGVPASPLPMPEDLRLAFIEAVWQNLPWQHTTWLGQRIESAPTDLIAYQEVIASVRPDLIVDIGTHDAGRTLFLASMCDLVGHGRVLCVGPDVDGDLPHHPRIEQLDGDPASNDVVERVHRAVAPGDSAMVVLGRARNDQIMRLFELYSPLVSPGSYVIVTDTVVNGNPVWTGFGPGPMEAVKILVQRHGDFFADPDMERYSLTFNPGGFLKRIGTAEGDLTESR